LADRDRSKLTVAVRGTECVFQRAPQKVLSQAQIAAANQAQWAAAQAMAPQVRLIAGPGTGKSATAKVSSTFYVDAKPSDADNSQLG
jgi:hypothetical protein